MPFSGLEAEGWFVNGLHLTRKHGPLDLETDPRDFIEEGIEELVDFLNYIELAMLQGKLSSGVEDRVKEFLETWKMRKAGEILPPEPARCTGCGVALEDGNFALVDSDLVCLNCVEGS